MTLRGAGGEIVLGFSTFPWMLDAYTKSVFRKCRPLYASDIF
jgi:hypothetical protein